MIRTLIAICSVFTLFITLGCGQKGALFLPPKDVGASHSSASQAQPDPQPTAEEADTDRPE